MQAYFRLANCRRLPPRDFRAFPVVEKQKTIIFFELQEQSNIVIIHASLFGSPGIYYEKSQAKVAKILLQIQRSTDSASFPQSFSDTEIVWKRIGRLDGSCGGLQTNWLIVRDGAAHRCGLSALNTLKHSVEHNIIIYSLSCQRIIIINNTLKKQKIAQNNILRRD